MENGLYIINNMNTKPKIVRLTEQDLVSLIKTILGGFDVDKQSGSESFDTNDLDDNISNKTTSDDEFYKKVLQCLGVKPTKGNMSFMYAWRQAEGGKATFNPFNTTKNMPGATIYNTHKVKNYRSMEDGVRATCETLNLRHYKDIVDGLKNDVGLYELSRMEGLKKWGTGQLLAKVADGYLAGATPKPGPIDTQIA
jgi:hypothetical protein